jgi:hypothetical protein
MRTAFPWIPTAALAVLALACGSSPPHRAAPAAEMELDDVTNGLTTLSAEDGSERARTENFFGRVPASKSASRPAPPEPAADRMMVYRGTVAVEVARVEDAIARFLARVQEWGGYLSARQDGDVTVRVPAPRFQEAIAELRGYGRVLSESMQADDVTKQHLDLSIRLENARKARDRLLALLEKADKVEDILKIEEQLRRLTEEIERMEGELKWLGDQVAMSTVTAAFRAVAETRPDRRRQLSRFDWINQVGVERLRRDF